MSKQAARRLHFGTDLRDQSFHHIAFLKAVDNVADLKKPYILKRAIYRYEKYWLPLAADHLKQCLAAPLDIEWVWHCHMLSPRAYERDCAATVGVTVNHTLRSVKLFQDKQQEAQRYWSQKYEGDHEPFFVDLSAPYDINAVESHKSKISYDIISAAQRQSVFYYQVSLPHYRDKKYLDNSLLRYKQFIYLKSQLPNDFLVPCYDIDLMWHSHQVNPLIYTQDMVRIIGNLFNHDDSTNDRSEGSKLHIADKKTRQHWKNNYNESFSLFGAMYRGNPPAGFLYKISSEETYGFCTKNSIITLEQLTLTLPSENPNRYKKIKLSGFSSAGNKTIDKWFAVNRPKDATPLATTLTWKGVGHFQFDTKTSNNITFWLQEQVGWGCCGSKTDVGSNVINLLPQVESSANAATGGRINAQIPLGANIPLDIQGQFAPPKRGRALLFLDQGKYEVAVIPENVQQLWGPVSLERLPPGTDNHCQVASHRLKNHLGNTEFTVRTIHSQPLMMSVVQVYYHDSMSVIGHLIASDQLPLPTQVSKDEITLNPKQGERAVLLKNNEGDWGIITGHWKGFKRGVAGTKRKRGVRGSPGTLFLKFYKFSTGRITTVELGYLRQDYMFTIESAQIDLMKGVLSIDSATNEVAESIAIAFSVSLLHVLCVPRPKGWVEGQQVKPSVTSRGSRSITTVPSDDMAFIMAAGLLWATPSNYYMHSYYGAHICAMCGGGGGGAMEYEGDWGDLPGGDADGGDAGCDGSACGGGADGGDGGGCGGGCGGCGG